MINAEQCAQLRIREAAKELLYRTKDTDQITVRQIAEQAKVGVGLINYHFGSKDALLSDIVAEQMSKMLQESDGGRLMELPPKDRLKTVLIQLSDVGAEYMSLTRFMIRHMLESGEMGSALTLVPLIKEALGDDTDEMNSRILALQLLYPLQIACISPEQFHLFSGIDLKKTDERAELVEKLINNLL